MRQRGSRGRKKKRGRKRSAADVIQCDGGFKLPILRDSGSFIGLLSTYYNFKA
jgi:hypothetical protein